MHKFIEVSNMNLDGLQLASGLSPPSEHKKAKKIMYVDQKLKKKTNIYIYFFLKMPCDGLAKVKAFHPMINGDKHQPP